MTHQTPEQRARILKQFKALAQHRRRYEVFRDFVTLSAISLNNVMEPDAERKAALEAEYMGIIRTYSHDEALGFAELLGLVVELLEPTPQDVLGDLYMELDLGNGLTHWPVLHAQLHQPVYGSIKWCGASG
jgi:hypothetical protein